MKLIIIAALARNRIIGKEGSIPWHFSEDLKRFKRLTMGHTIVMGRVTYESIGKPLTGRKNVVITTRSIPTSVSDSMTSILTFPSPETALNALKHDEKVFIIGGGQLYQYFLSLADEMYLTILSGEYEGDTYFPEYEELVNTRFRLQNEEVHEDYTFRDYIKLK